MRRVTVPTDRVAVIGAGSSALVVALVQAGYQQVTAIDISAAALEALARRLGDDEHLVRRLVADVREVDLGHLVDLWFDRATFHFLTEPADQARYRDRAAAAVRVGGTMVIAGFAPTGPEQCSGLPVARHDAVSLRAVFDGAFELTDFFEHDHTTPWSSVQRFGYATFIRRDG